MRIRKIFKNKALLFILLSIIFIRPYGACADSSASTHLQVYPVKIDMSAKPGESVCSEINVVNRSKFSARMNISAQDFTLGKNHEYEFYDPGKEVTSMSAARWLSFSDRTFELKPEEKKKIDVVLSVPKEAEPGGHYAMVFIEADPIIPSEERPKGAYIRTKTRVGALILGTVSGKIKRSFDLKSFRIPKYSFDSSVPVSITYENKGNVHATIKGEVVFTNWKGRNIGSIPIANRTSLPSTTLTINGIWKSTVEIGRVTATIKIISKDGRKWVRSQSFFVFPLKKAGLILGIIVIILLGWYIITKKFSFRIEKRPQD